MEPVGIVLGVLPLLGGAVKAYSSVRKRSKEIGHFPREIRLLRKRLIRQQHIFVQESHLLIGAAINDKARVQRMIYETTHVDWHSEDLETALRKLLASSYTVYLEAIEEIHTEIKNLDVDLSKYEELSSHRVKGENIHETARRLGYHVKIAWTKEEFEKTIDTLRKLNGDLEQLRKQACELKVENDMTQCSRARNKSKMLQASGSYQQIQDASTALYRALQFMWTCDSSKCAPPHERHQVRMFTNARLEGHVCMEVDIQCSEFDSYGTVSQSSSSWKLYKIQSQDLQWIERAPLTPPANDGERSKRVRFENVDNCSTGNAGCITRPESTINLQFTYHTPPECEAAPTIEVICFSLQRETRKDITVTPSYLGYVDNLATEKPAYRHHFHSAESTTTMPKYCATFAPRQRGKSTLSDVSEALSTPAEHTVSILEQLRLARDIASTFLRFHSTPWMGQYVTTKDLSLLKNSSKQLGDYLDTLHFSRDFVHNSAKIIADTDMLDDCITSARINYGLRNTTLWCLGVILLQIGRWENIRDVDDIGKIRGMVARVDSLGPRFQRLTERCLNCDFGYGDDLCKPRLQQAVHRRVVNELSEMIESLELRDSDPEE